MNLKSIKPATTGEAQELFMLLLPRLLDYIHDQGYRLRGGDLYRDPRVFGEIGERLGYGHPRSGHKRRLAVDFNLFKDGVYLNKTEDHQKLGEWWEKQHSLCRWGGRFEDGNHYSLEWDGVK
jgi:hypothetical protein